MAWLLPVAISWMLIPSVQAPNPGPIVRLSLACRVDAATGLTLRVDLQNPGSIDTGVLLGLSFANGRQYELRNLTLLIRQLGEEAFAEYEYRPLHYLSGVAGRIDHWIVGLPTNAAISFNVVANDFFTPVRAVRLTRLPSTAELSVRLVGRPVTADLNLDMTGVRLIHLWTGTATSDTVKVPDGCAQ